MIWLAMVIIMIVISLGLVIFAPSEKVFFNKEIYPSLDILTDRMQLQLIRDDLARVSDDQFLDYPDPDMWKRTSTYQAFPFYMFGAFAKANIELCPDTFRIAQNIPGVRTMAFIKLGPKSVLKVHQSWHELSNDTFRCVLGLDIPANDINACGIWVNGNVKKIEDDKWVIFDASKRHSMFNRQDNPCYLLMFDLQRPTAVRGVSTYPAPDFSDFIRQFEAPEKVSDQVN